MDPELPPEVSQLLASDPERFSRHLSHQEWMFLTYGDSGGPDCPFQNELEAAAVWAVHRRLLMASYRNTGKRPVAWWVLEHPEVRWRGPDRERSTLFNAGLLEPAERDQLIAEWRREFEHAEGLDPDARQRHHAWADIPRSLLKAWRAEKKTAA